MLRQSYQYLSGGINFHKNVACKFTTFTQNNVNITLLSISAVCRAADK